jgi:hypothetical protein
MHKLAALLPLLGWFYITIGIFVLVVWILGRRLKWLETVYYFFFALLALIFMARSLFDEFALYNTSKITLNDSFEQKIANEAGGYYQTYYLELRPALGSQAVVTLPNVDVREFYYARMFLYPANVLMSDMPDTQLSIVDTSSLDRFTRAFHVLKKGTVKSLIKYDTLPSPAPSPTPQPKGVR